MRQTEFNAIMVPRLQLANRFQVQCETAPDASLDAGRCFFDLLNLLREPD